MKTNTLRLSILAVAVVLLAALWLLTGCEKETTWQPGSIKVLVYETALAKVGSNASLSLDNAPVQFGIGTENIIKDVPPGTYQVQVRSQSVSMAYYAGVLVRPGQVSEVKIGFPAGL